MSRLPIFSLALLHPRYWLTWFGIAALWLVVQLPYPLLHYLGCTLGKLAMPFMSRRVEIARRNLELCFPAMSDAELEALTKKNFQSVGMGLLETGMAWFWPDWRLRRIISVSGLEHIDKARADGQGILLIGMHFLTLELGARIFGMHNPGIGVYRPNNNALLDWLQTRGRMRSNASMINRDDIKGMIRALKNGEIIWYAPDHDYGPKASIFAPFFAVPDAASTRGSYVLIRAANPAIIPFVPRRLAHGRGYELIIMPNAQNIPVSDELVTAIGINQLVEHAVQMAPEQYMWLHRRFKTRPPGSPSLY